VALLAQTQETKTGNFKVWFLSLSTSTWENFVVYYGTVKLLQCLLVQSQIRCGWDLETWCHTESKYSVSVFSVKHFLTYFLCNMVILSIQSLSFFGNFGKQFIV
jgi:hypothetical protein